jgi:hypothetical protein
MWNLMPLLSPKDEGVWAGVVASGMMKVVVVRMV